MRATQRFRERFCRHYKDSRLLKEMLSVPLMINTRQSIEVARAVDAEGVYLEGPFPPYSAARKLLKEKIIGIPVKTMEDVAAAGHTDVNYISVKISPSKRTCPRNDALWGMEGLREIRAISPHRIVAIGGLNLECAAFVYQELRAHDGIAMAGGLMDAEDPCETARKILALRQNIGRSS